MRISRHQMFMSVAEVIARRSTCMRLNVGAVIVVDKNVVAHGYNGPPSGEPHCTGRDCCEPGKGCHRAVHAEINAIKRVPWDKLSSVKSMYVTDSPCPTCLQNILRDRTITELYYGNLYRLNDHLTDCPIPLYRVTPSGFLIDHKTGELIDAG